MSRDDAQIAAELDAAKRPSWLNACAHEGDTPVGNLANVLHALRSAPELRGALAYDEMQFDTMLMHPLPGTGEAAEPSDFRPRPVMDRDVLRIQEMLQRWGMRRLGSEVLHQAVDYRASERPFHPVRDYLAALEWDGTPRLERWLSYYLGAEHSPYLAEIGRMFLTAMVARVMKPGCKADYMIVLEGSQGVGKSTACRILGGDWYSDSLPDLSTGKDVSQHMRGLWLIEVAELAAFGRSDSPALKSFISRQTERYRPSYGKRDVVQPRQCLLIGTVNGRLTLRDSTGGRRFWPVAVGAIDLDALAHDRDQLFAEAVHCYEEGMPWWPEREVEAQHIKPQQDDRLEADMLEDELLPLLKGKHQCSIAQLVRSMGEENPMRVPRDAQRRIAEILTRSGWRSRKTMGRMVWERDL